MNFPRFRDDVLDATVAVQTGGRIVDHIAVSSEVYAALQTEAVAQAFRGRPSLCPMAGVLTGPDLTLWGYPVKVADVKAFEVVVS